MYRCVALFLATLITWFASGCESVVLNCSVNYVSLCAEKKKMKENRNFALSFGPVDNT